MIRLDLTNALNHSLVAQDPCGPAIYSTQLLDQLIFARNREANGFRQTPDCQEGIMIVYDTFKTLASSEINYKTRTIHTPTMRKSFETIIAGNPFRPFVIDEGWLSVDIPQAMKFLDRTNGRL